MAAQGGEGARKRVSLMSLADAAPQPEASSRTHPGVGSHGSDVTSGVVLRR